MRIQILTAFFIISCLSLKAQITITTADLPSAGDTFRVSNGLITPAIDPAPTGPNYTWDFSTLQWITQDVDTFLTVSSTGPIYSVVFANFSFNPNRANQAVVGPDLPSLPQISITEVHYYYYNATNAYDLKGYGAKINGITTPLPFNNLDRVLDFPVNYGNIDSSDSDYSLSVPTLGGYFHTQRRVNEVDGWGTLITPYGTFNTLRVKSIITGRDSLDLDTLGGFGFSLPLTTEYKWYGTNQGIPLLQINTSTTFGFELITSIVYRDSLRTLTSALAETAGTNPVFSIYPNPATESFTVDVSTAGEDKTEISLVDIAGRKVKEVYSGVLQKGSTTLHFTCAGIPSGIYFVRMITSNGSAVSRIVIQ